MNPNYADIFAVRGHNYHQAMQREPAARACEFESLFTKFAPRTGERVLDFPAGGGYLAGYLDPGVDVVGLELAPFGGNVPVHDPSERWAWGNFDHCVCLAALHHIDDQRGFVASLLDKLVPGGILHVADVAAESPIRDFLDGFVGRYNLTGHRGQYLAGDGNALVGVGKLRRIETLPCPWQFADESSMLAFCNDLFGLVDCPPEALRDALAKHVGIVHQDGTVQLAWELLYIDIEREQAR